MPSPRSVSTSPGWVPAGISIEAAPSSVGTSSVRADRRQRRGHVERGDQVVALAHEALVGAHPHEHVQVARRGARPRRRARWPPRRMRWPSAIPAGTSTVELALGRAAAAPAALPAGLAGDASVAVAGVADDRAHHLPEGRAGHRLQLPGAAAALAGLDRGARLGAVAVAVLAALDRLEGDLDLGALGGLRAGRSRPRRRRRLPAAGPARRRTGSPPKNASNRSPIEPKPSKLGA